MFLLNILYILLIITIPVLFLILHLIKYLQYIRTSYFKITNNSYFDVLFNTGIVGEYSIYNQLKKYEKNGEKFLFNLYIPTNNNKTTEIDIVMISSIGIFVFESKNFSGWIFGKEKLPTWTQSFHIGKGKTKKKHFYNPIMQNEYHIKYLKNIIGNNIKTYSIIVFSDSCILKKLNKSIDSKNHVIYLHQLNKLITKIYKKEQKILSQEEIENLYNKLYKYTQVDENTKLKHISNLKN